MGKKYIIELLDDCQSEFKGIMAFGLTQEKQISVELIPEEGLRPYTEPDLEQVKSDAYNDGYKAGREAEEVRQKLRQPDLEQVRKEAYDDGYNAGYGRKIDASYQEGFSDAWEAARKIVHMPEGDLLNIFTECYSAVCTSVQVFLKYDASEAIEKIRQYEQEQEEQITKGDIVLIKSTPEVEILVTYADEEYVSGIALTEVDGNCEIGDQYIDIRISNVEKTGKHYDIVSVLQKMREE